MDSMLLFENMMTNEAKDHIAIMNDLHAVIPIVDFTNLGEKHQEELKSVHDKYWNYDSNMPIQLMDDAKECRAMCWQRELEECNPISGKEGEGQG